MWYNLIAKGGKDVWVNTALVVKARRGDGNHLVLDFVDVKTLITNEDFGSWPPAEPEQK